VGSGEGVAGGSIERGSRSAFGTGARVWCAGDDGRNRIVSVIGTGPLAQLAAMRSTSRLDLPRTAAKSDAALALLRQGESLARLLRWVSPQASISSISGCSRQRRAARMRR
jgi:hypothetical protein